MARTTSCVVAFAAALAGCVGSGDVPTQISGQIVGDDGSPIGPGLVLIERGKVHQGSYETGALIGPDGRFTAPLGSGGTWGIHLFYNETYTYLPLEVTIADHQQIVLLSSQISWGIWMDLTGQPTWPDQPSDSTLVRMPFDDNLNDNPVLKNVTMSYRGAELMDITAEVNDPNGDLSRMILVYDPTTRNGFAMSPPSPPDARGNYPNGIYTLTVFVDEAHVPGESPWHFIVSDNLCNNTPVQIYTMPAR